MGPIVTYDTACFASEMGYDEECYWYYDIETEEMLHNPDPRSYDTHCPAPTQSDLQNYLRLKYKIYVGVEVSLFTDFFRYTLVSVMENGEKLSWVSEDFFEIWEDTLEEGLKEGINQIEYKS